jgi:hypothetical protein
MIEQPREPTLTKALSLVCTPCHHAAVTAEIAFIRAAVAPAIKPLAGATRFEIDAGL